MILLDCAGLLDKKSIPAINKDDKLLDNGGSNLSYALKNLSNAEASISFTISEVNENAK